MRDDLDVVPVQWVNLQRGSKEIIGRLSHLITKGPLEPLFAPWQGLDRNQPHPLPPIEEERFSELPTTWTFSALSPAEKETLDMSFASLRRVFHLLAYNPDISKLSAVMSWFSMLSADYIRMLKDKVPEALLIVVMYCVALKRADNMWWMSGKGQNLMRTVMGELGDGWERWTSWPVQQVLGPGGERTFFGREAAS